jgi:vacuolar-type H+-ATPase subunit E/Vma4
VAFSELLQALRAEAASRRAEEVAAAEREIERIRAESSAALARRKQQHVERATREATEKGRRSLAEARTQATASVLHARDRLLGRVRCALQERARAATADPAYRASLTTLLVEALERLPVGPVVVRTRAEFADAVADGARGRSGVVVEAVADMGTGFVALAPESGVEIDATLEAVLEHRWPQLAVTVLAEVGR